MFNKRKILLLMVILIVFMMSHTAIYATDNMNDSQIENYKNSSIENNQIDISTNKQLIAKTENKEIKTSTYAVSNENYGKYFDNEEGTTNTNIKENDTIVLVGEFDEKNFVIDKKAITLTGNNAKINNGQIMVMYEAQNSIISNITINTQNYEQAIFNEANNVTIKNNVININNTDGVTVGIENYGENSTISNNTVDVKGAAKNINFESGDRQNLAYTFSIFNQANNVLIENNTAKASRHPDGVNENVGTIDSIEVQGDKDKIAQNVTINNNKVYVSGARYAYGINALNGINEITVTNNTITATSERYANGIQMGDNANNIIIENNIIKVNCSNTTTLDGVDEAIGYGIIITSTSSTGTDNFTVNKNTINLSASVGYGVEVFQVHNSSVNGNNINVTSIYAMGIGVSLSKDNNITNNNINTYGDSSVEINSIEENIRPENTGIVVQQKSNNNIINKNTIRSYDANNKSMGVASYSNNNVTVTYNDIVANSLYGDNAVINKSTTNSIIENNTSPYEKLNAIIKITAPKTIDTGEKATFNITVTDENNNPLNGTAIIKISGITLKQNNTQINLNVTNGKTNLTYTLAGYSARTYPVTAVFIKEGYNRAENTTQMTINKGTYVLNLITINSTSEATITINETIKDTHGNTITGNTKIAIKIKNKTITTTTIKDGQLNINITLPYLPAGNLPLTIILGNNYRYNLKTINSTATINKQDITINITPITANPGQEIQITATLTNKNTKTPVLSGKYILKINQKTIPYINENYEEIYTTQTITNGQATWTYFIPNTIKDGTYNITLVYQGNKQSNQARYTTPTLTITG